MATAHHMHAIVFQADADNASSGITCIRSGPMPPCLSGRASCFSGYTVDIGGDAYAVFRDSHDPTLHFIPYDPARAVPSSSAGDWRFAETPASDTVASCFLEGTRIATAQGETAVEDLQIGDLIKTVDGREVAIAWIAEQTQRRTVNRDLPDKFAPVQIEAGALGLNIPHSDLYLTADHGLIIDGFVVNAGAMVNDLTIRSVPMKEMPHVFTYYHIETEHHDVLVANGAAAETFVGHLARRSFDNYRDYIARYGRDRRIREMPHPRIASQPQLPLTMVERFGATLYHQRVIGTVARMKSRLPLM